MIWIWKLTTNLYARTNRFASHQAHHAHHAHQTRAQQTVVRSTQSVKYLRVVRARTGTLPLTKETQRRARSFKLLQWSPDNLIDAIYLIVSC